MVLTKDMKSESISCLQKNKTEGAGNDSQVSEELKKYDYILVKYFPKGYRVNSKLDLKKFVCYFNNIYKTNFDISDRIVCKDMQKHISQSGIKYKGYVFAVDSLLSNELRESLLAYIKNFFRNGKKILYYKTIFQHFNDNFLGQRIYDEYMLKVYLQNICNNEYYFENNYLTKEGGVQIEIVKDIKNCLLHTGTPMNIKELCKILSYIPENKIKLEVQRNREFIYNTRGEYFHVSMVDFSNEELENICKIIDYRMVNNNFISFKEVIEDIKRKYSDLLERFLTISMNGLRDSIAFFLHDKYSFKGNIISLSNNPLSVKDVFCDFAKTHESFTIDELNQLKSEMDSPIYFEEIYANSLRVSKRQFVAKEQIDFEIQKIDEAIGIYCPNDYIPLKAITSFGGFPYIGYAWNIYLLENYIANYSAAYKLIHIGFNSDSCAGAIVKRTSAIETYNDLIMDVLTSCEVDLNREDALQYLYDLGYIARKRFDNIEKILCTAKARKG